MALTVKAPKGENAALLASDPATFFMPPYVAHHGYVGVYLDTGAVDWDEIRELTWEAGGMRVSPMFPLGTVLVPGTALPLHVFEPRYRRMVDDCRAGDGTFGVVLIERGSEIGGGDVRTDVGTLAEIVQAEALPDGRWMLVALGMHRIRVERWLPDDPYPRAEIVDWPEEPDDDDRAEVTTLLRRVAALRREMGEPASPLDLGLDPDPVVASHQSIALSHLGTADRQRLLEAPTLAARSQLLRRLLTDQIELLQARLAQGR